ncbi:hypothetical protein GZH49_02945 [Nocardia terpenica]|uniref:hypothetical protein n=1 Tax=Nocardia terpenica TaxID=455432 RepID=UPI002FE0C467
MKQRTNAPRCGGCWQVMNSDSRQGWSWHRNPLLCKPCATAQDRHPEAPFPITEYTAEIATLTDEDWLPDFAVATLEDVQAPQTTWEGRTSTELARIVANFHGWQFYGNTLCTPDGMIIARRLELAAETMQAMEWFTPTNTGINWRTFTAGRPPETCTYPSAFALRRRIGRSAY